jgi:hypothetical protein
MDEDPPTPEKPLYWKLRHNSNSGSLFLIVCDEGWRTSIVCEDMYEWAADWLIGELGRRPYAPGLH